MASLASQAGALLLSREGSTPAITQAVPPSPVMVLPPKQAARSPLTPLLGKVFSQAGNSLPTVSGRQSSY